ncbi:MAG: glycosyltransferase family 4 protein [Planctomycetota bacterium]|jgi:glycosyltransferase involved in cell wall biosynthesis|nr:glycosyltransferase family 4 protein [Planctomycetota bacterium]
MSPPLRIALVLNPFTLDTKGGSHAPNLARELLGRGHTLRSFGAPPGAIPRSGEEEEGTAAPGAATLAGFAPDVIVAYDALSPAAFMGARVSRKIGVPLVLIEAGFAGVGSPMQRLLRGVGERLWGSFVRRTRPRVVALDPLAGEQAVREGFDPERVEVLGEGVDLATFRPGLYSGLIARHRVRGRVLLYVGRIGERRGLDVLIDAFAATVGQRSDWALVLAGEGPGRRRLRAQANRLGIGARVVIASRPRDEELPGLIGSSTSLVVPAVDDSVRGKQIPRAMACGVGVLASDLPRLRWLVEDDRTGLLAAAGDRSAWKRALARAAGAPMARRRWGLFARERAEKRFDWGCVAQSFEELLLAATSEREISPVAGERAPGDLPA